MLRFTIILSLVVCALGGVPRIHRPRYNGRIVGGEDAKIGDYPYQLSLHYYGSFLCGASVISENFAVTAAHCTDGSSANAFTVRAGSEFLDSGGTVYSIAQIIQNDGFNEQEMDYDISLLKVVEPFSFGPTVQSISLPDAGTPVETGTAVDVSGWGTTSSGGPLPDHLLHVVVHVTDQQACNAAYGSITDRMLCAADPGKDSCQGDSGGPLVDKGVLVGIVSFGYGCAERGYPGVYANVTALRDWITTNSGI